MKLNKVTKKRIVFVHLNELYLINFARRMAVRLKFDFINKRTV